MAEPNDAERERAAGTAAGAQQNLTDAQKLKAQRGGEQSDQISGETARGAQNQDQENRNPSGNKPNQNHGARQKGNTL